MKSFRASFLLLIQAYVLIIFNCFTEKKALCEVKKDGDWIVSVWECRAENITKEEAIRRALNEAREGAIAFAAGITLSSDVTIGQTEQRILFEKYTNINTTGHIVEEQKPKVSEIDDYGTDEHGISIKKYSVTLHCKVETEKGTPDPSFDVSITMNKIYYNIGEPIEFEVTATKNCYVTVLNVHGFENKVHIIFPNEYDNDNFLPGNTIKKIPSPNSGVVLRVYSSDTLEQSQEHIKIIATKKKVDFHAGLPKESIFNYHPTPVTAGSAIGKRLVNMPRNEWATAVRIILIKGNDE